MADRHRDDRTLTTDFPVPGVAIRQPRRGYRWGVEVYLLADFALGDGAVRTAVDLGTGSGIVALLLATRGVAVTAVERSPSWVPLARENVAGHDVTVVEADVREWQSPAVEVVVANPPWFDPATGPVSPDRWKAESRTALFGSPEDFVRAGLRHAGRVCVVGPRPVVVPGAFLARVARSGRLVLSEVRPGEGSTREEGVDLAAVYGRFGR